jgi:RimJ/RimL family protein N-acetyltransferase
MKTHLTKRLHLKPYSPTDYTAWAHSYQTLLPKQSPHDWVPPKSQPPTRAFYAKYVRRCRERARTDDTYIWGLFHRRTHQHLGRVDIKILHRGPLQVANLGYRLHNNHWRLGYMTEALRVLIPAALKEFKLNRLEAVIDLDNRASIALCKTLKLRHEGIRKHFYYQNKGWADQVVYVADRKLLRLPPLHPN